MNSPEPCSVYDPCTYITYQDLRENFFYAVFDNGLVATMPYKRNEEGHKVVEWERVPIYYRRN